MNNEPVTGPGSGKRFLGSLRDALAAAGRDELKTDEKKQMEARAQSKAATKATPTDDGASQLAPAEEPLALAAPGDAAKAKTAPDAPVSRSAAPADTAGGEELNRQSAADAARQARGEVRTRTEGQHIEMEDPTTKLSKGGNGSSNKKSGGSNPGGAPPQTQLVRGKAKVGREDFGQDPVVGWLVIVGGPGLGSYRPIFEGNNAIGRSSSQRIPVDFGDEAISSEEQAYIRYDSMDRSFLFVPNLAKTNVVQVNHQKPTSAVSLSGMDVITMGRTQLVFVPFCSSEFDWSELSDLKE